MNEKTIGFIGGGNMATSLIGGLIADGFPAQRIWVSDVDPAKLASLQNDLQVNTTRENGAVVAHSEVLVMAVKPQVLRTVAESIKADVKQQRPLIISIAAGIRERDLERWLAIPAAIVRCMPNTPALVQTGATALHANKHVSDIQRDVAESILRAVGVTLWVTEEAHLDTVTALSGSGPAYFFLLMEAMEKAAVSQGLPETTARLLTQQTALGAAKMAISADESPAELRRRVTSPGGTTERAIEVFERGGFAELVEKALRAAKDRSIELSIQLGGK